MLSGIIIGLSRWRNNTSEYKWIIVLLIATFITESIAITIVKMKGYNVSVYKTFDFIHPAIMTVIFYHIYRSEKLKRFCVYLGIVVLISSLISSIIYRDPATTNTISVIIKSSYFIILSLLKYKELLLQPDEDNILTNGIFWFCSSLLFFNCATIMYWVTMPKLYELQQAKLASKLHLAANFIFYSLIVFSIILMQPKPVVEYLSDD